MQQPIYPTTRSFKWVWLLVAASLGVFVLMVGLGLWLRRPLSPSVVAVPTPTLSPQVEIAYQQGIIYLNDGKPELALIEFEKMLVPAPNYKDTVVRRQEARRQSEAKEEERKAQQDLKIGKFCEAADRLQKLRYEPSVNQTLVVDDLFKAYRECSRLRLAQNDVKSALSQMDNALSLPNRSEDAEARAQKKLLEDYQGSLVAFKAGQWDETITNLEPLIEQLPSLARETLAQAYLNRGRQTRAGGALEHYEQAIADLERAEAYWPAHVEIKTELGESRAALFKLYVGEARQLLAAGECATMGRVREMLDKAKTLNPIAPELAELEAPLEKLGGVTVVEVANSRRDFSGTQGGRGWSYLVVGGAGQIQPINFWDEATQEWYTFHRWVRIGASDAHPGYQPASNSSDVIRRWRSSVNGRVRIYVTAYKLDTGTPTTFGDGVVVYIKHRGTSIWSGYIAPRNAVGVRGWLAVTRDVAVGDNLDFGLAPFRDASHDHTLFEISIRWEKPGCAG
jgi:tetratricopeptide (TPR) repeat protein